MEFPSFEVTFATVRPIKESPVKLVRAYVEASGADTAIVTAREALNLPAEHYEALEVLRVIITKSQKA